MHGNEYQPKITEQHRADRKEREINVTRQHANSSLTTTKLQKQNKSTRNTLMNGKKVTV
jgi:hypothetical protein